MHVHSKWQLFESRVDYIHISGIISHIPTVSTALRAYLCDHPSYFYVVSYSIIPSVLSKIKFKNKGQLAVTNLKSSMPGSN